MNAIAANPSELGPFERLALLKGALVRVSDVAKVLSRSRSFVIEMIEEGKLVAFAPSDRKKKRYRITKESVAELLSSQISTSIPEAPKEKRAAPLAPLRERSSLRRPGAPEGGQRAKAGALPDEPIETPEAAFEFLCSIPSALLSVKQAAAAFNRKAGFVTELIEEGKLEAFAPVGRIKKRYQVTKRSVLKVLAEQSNLNGEDFARWATEFVNHLSRKQLDDLSGHIARRRERFATGR